MLSIIVPVYNSEKTIKKCLTSIQQSTYKDFECIIIDDGSTDKSYEIANNFKDKRFKVIKSYNQGVSQARNIGLFLSKGEWITFCDSDDTIIKNKYEKMLNTAKEQNVNIVQCDVNVYKDDKLKKIWSLGSREEDFIYNVNDGRVLSNFNYDIGHCWDKIYSRKILKDLYFPKNINMCEDTIFNLQAFFKSEKIYALHIPLHNYFQETNTLSHKQLQIKEAKKLKDNIQKQLEELKTNKWYNIYKNSINNLFASIFSRYEFIDYVFPYVDCSKENWKKEYSKFSKTSIDEKRFNGHESLLKFKFRAMEKYAPWIDNVYMIVSDDEQVPDWINRDTVKIIYHKDIIPEKYLPTFNSCTIEMFLHNIPGLSKKFIYSNDDIYMNDALKPKFFFVDNKIRMNLFDRKLWHKEDINSIWAQIPQNTIKLAAKDKPEYLKKYVDGIHLYELAHVDRPMIKSNNEQTFNLYKEEIENSISQFREAKNLNQSLFTEYLMFHDKAIWEMYRFDYCQIGNDTQRIIDDLTAVDKKPREICCNDSVKATKEDYDKILSTFNKLYKNKSKYEKS